MKCESCWDVCIWAQIVLTVISFRIEGIVQDTVERMKEGCASSKCAKLFAVG